MNRAHLLNRPPFTLVFRSEEMMLAQLIIPADAAHETITLLGQFKDLNADKSAFQRTYANQALQGLAFVRDTARVRERDLTEKDKTDTITLMMRKRVKRCDEMLRKLRFFSDQITKSDIMVSPKAGNSRPYDLDELEVIFLTPRTLYTAYRQRRALRSIVIKTGYHAEKLDFRCDAQCRSMTNRSPYASTKPNNRDFDDLSFNKLDFVLRRHPCEIRVS
eukprot:1193685-Prorocentrum_minimum.AAC.3